MAEPKVFVLSSAAPGSDDTNTEVDRRLLWGRRKFFFSFCRVAPRVTLVLDRSKLCIFSTAACPPFPIK